MNNTMASAEENVLERPCRSLDLNPIEMLWQDLKRAIHSIYSKNIAKLKKMCSNLRVHNITNRHTGQC